jgi:iron complex transport system permease protein
MALVAAALAGMLAGSVPVGWGDLVHMVGWKLGIVGGTERLSDSVLWAIRLPRVLSGAAAGAALGLAGAALQGTFRNPMADPHLVGIAPGAGLGAVAGIALTPAGGYPILMILGGALGGTVLAWAMRRLARNVPGPTQLILLGLALGLALLAWLGAIVLAWDSPRVPTFSFWVFGGLSGSTWTTLGIGFPVLLAGAGLILVNARSLDLLALGETEAGHLGVPVDRVLAAVLTGTGIVVGVAVGLAGVVGFVGLVVPIVLRRLVGPGHRMMLPLAAIGGAVMLIAIDTLARTVAAPVEIPVGLLTAILGAPVLIWFLVREAVL